MVIAFVLITIEAGEEDTATEKVRKIDAVTETNRVYGAFDMVARIEEQSHDKLTDVVSQIRNTSGVRSTLTLTGTGD